MCPKFNQAMGMCGIYAKTPDRAHRRWQTWLAGVGSNHAEMYCLSSGKYTSCANYTRDDTPSGGSRRGCYVATCVYGTYDCPEVWMLRRFRDNTLSSYRLGRLFIRLYYAVSPRLVRKFGEKAWFGRICKPAVNSLVVNLQKQGVDKSPYSDRL